jgi:hypothetical protein
MTYFFIGYKIVQVRSESDRIRILGLRIPGSGYSKTFLRVHNTEK